MSDKEYTCDDCGSEVSWAVANGYGVCQVCDDKQRAVQKARLDPEGTAKPKTEIVAHHLNNGDCILPGIGAESYTIRHKDPSEAEKTPIVGIRLSKHTSQFGIVKAVEEVISSLPNGYIIDCNGKPVHNVYVRGALSYSARIMSDPWSKNYPTKQEVIATCAKDALVEVILWDFHLDQRAM